MQMISTRLSSMKNMLICGDKMQGGPMRHMKKTYSKILKSGKICNAAFLAGETIVIDGSAYLYCSNSIKLLES